MSHLEQESFVVLFLDARQRVIDVREAAVGSLSSVDVHPREIFRDAIRMRAHSVIVAHNHPSGDPDPSDADIDLTHRLVDVGKMVGIPVLDHVIVGGDDAVSLSSMGLMGD
jgi:DNA repair protein RadC